MTRKVMFVASLALLALIAVTTVRGDAKSSKVEVQ